MPNSSAERLRFICVLAVSSVLTGCGGGSSDSTGPGPTGPVATVEVTPGSPTVLTDDQVTLKATLKDASGTVLSGRPVTWSSSNETLATVSSDGVVMPLTLGDVRITAASEGKTGSATVAVRIRFVQASVNYSHTCALTATGAAWCWGSNARGELGIGVASSVNQLTPVRVGGGLRFQSISTGVDHTCGLQQDGTAWCWGRNDLGQLGSGTLDPPSGGTPSPSQVAGGYTFVAITAGGRHTCGLTNGGRIYCWGDNTNGQVNGVASSPIAAPLEVPAPAGFPAQPTYVAISAGWRHTCATASDADNAGLWCWGDNGHGQLGRPPGAVAGLVEVGDLVRAGRLSAGGLVTCAVGLRQLDSQTLEPAGMCWGTNSTGELQDPDLSKQRTFPNLQGALGIASGSDFVCEVQPNGVLVCWGNNAHGELGRGSPAFSDPQPAAVALSATFSGVYAGSQSSSVCALSSDGLLYCFGANDFGQLGDGTSDNRGVPTPVFGQE